MAGPMELNQDGGSMVTDHALGRLIRVDLRDIRTRETTTSRHGWRAKKKGIICNSAEDVSID